VHGKLTLAGVDPSRVSAARWLDAVYAILMEAPAEALERMNDQLTLKTNIVRPNRETWGLTPEQIEMQSRLTAGGQVPKR
jgi:hypothetical protein